MTKKRKKKSHRLYALVVILLGIAIIAASFFLLFYVQKIEVTGNEYTEDQVIVESMQTDELSINSVYLLIKYRFMKYDMPGSLTSMKVGLKNPWTVKVTVKEREIVGYLYEDDNYVFFDKDGIVVLKGREMVVDAPCIEGIDISKAKLYEPLKVKSKKLLEAILDVAREVKDYELTPDRIVCTDEGIELYFGEIRVMLGTDVTTEKMAQIAPILEKLEGKKGTLHLEHFESETNSITFSEETAEEGSNESGTSAEPVESVDAGYDGGESGGGYEDDYEDDYDYGDTYENDYDYESDYDYENDYDDGYYDE